MKHASLILVAFAVGATMALQYAEESYGSDGYNTKGYDYNGYNRDGYNTKGYDRHGYDRSGYKEGYNRHGYDRKGYDRSGYNKHGYNKRGYDRSGRSMKGSVPGVEVEDIRPGVDDAPLSDVEPACLALGGPCVVDAGVNACCSRVCVWPGVCA